MLYSRLDLLFRWLLAYLLLWYAISIASLVMRFATYSRNLCQEMLVTVDFSDLHLSPNMSDYSRARRDLDVDGIVCLAMTQKRPFMGIVCITSWTQPLGRSILVDIAAGPFFGGHRTTPACSLLDDSPVVA